MFFKFVSGKDEKVKMIKISLHNIDEDVKDHLIESLKGKVKIDDDKILIKCDMTFEELGTLNEGYNQFHSQFIIDNLFTVKTSDKV